MPSPALFAQLLKGFRARSGLTQEALAASSGLSVEAVRTLERGRRRYPRQTTVEQLSHALRLLPSERQQLETAASRQGHARQLAGEFPAALDDFTGRANELGELVRILSRADEASPSVIISAIGGMGGIGKTVLAVKAAQLVSDRYPDGQLYLNLGGGDTEPVRTADALAALLNALGVPPSGDPEDVQLASARYRTALAGRRMLLLLDDAASPDQVTPLIPGTKGSAVLITSREQLAAIPGAQYLGLQAMSEDEALQLLGEVAGPELVSADLDAAQEVVRYCGLLPLAIRIAGAHPSARTPGELALLGRLLADDTTRLDTLTIGAEVGVRASITLSLRALAEGGRPGDAACAEAFPLLGLFEGDHFSLRVAAKVLELKLDEAEDLLERLVDVHLLETPAPYQYRMHDLVRDIGRELAADTMGLAARERAWDREISCYFAVLWRLSELHGGRHPEEAAKWSAGAEDLADLEVTAAWLESETGNLLRIIRKAAAGGREDRLTAARMGWGMFHFAAVRMRFAESRDALLAVVGILDHPDDELDDRLWVSLGQLYSALEQPHLAIDCQRVALPLARARGDNAQVVTCLIELAYASVRAGRPVEALPAIDELRLLAPQVERAHLEAAANLVAGVTAGALGDVAGQREAFDRAIAVHLLRGDGQVPLLHTEQMGLSLVESGQYDAGWPMLTEALVRARGAKLSLIEFDLLSDLGKGWSLRNDHQQSRAYFEQALEIAVRFPAENREAKARCLLGREALALGATEEARLHWQRALDLNRRVADPAAEEVQALLDSLPAV